MSSINNYDMQTAMSGMQAQNVQAQRNQISMLGNTKDPDTVEKEKMREACEGFEAIFIQQMWQQMRASLPDDGLFTSSKEEKFWQGMYDQELAKSMASSGGIGLADMMMEQMSPKGTAEASKQSQARSTGLEVPPAPLLKTQAPEEVQKAENQAPSLTIPTQQKAPIMNNIYDTPLEEANLLASQNIDNTLSSSNTAEDVQAEPIITRITYQTNRPENKRAAETLIAELLEQQRKQAEQNLQNKQDENEKTQVIEEIASAVKEMATEEFEEMEPILIQQSPSSPIAPLSQEKQNEIQNILSPKEDDILAGITQSYVKTNQEIPTLQNNLIAQRNYSEQVANQAILQPTYAGGPDMLRPQTINATTELGSLNPEKGSFQSPVDGNITSGFGWRLDPINGKRSWHNGVDITAQENSPVKAAQDGIVKFAGHDEEFGNMIIVEHANGLSTLYGHNASLNVQAGDYVSKGTEIARVGSSGRALGQHVHFEIRKADMPINPETVLIQGDAIYS